MRPVSDIMATVLSTYKCDKSLLRLYCARIVVTLGHLLSVNGLVLFLNEKPSHRTGRKASFIHAAFLRSTHRVTANLCTKNCNNLCYILCPNRHRDDLICSYFCLPVNRAHSSGGEHLLDMQEVPGSIPGAPTKFSDLPSHRSFKAV